LGLSGRLTLERVLNAGITEAWSRERRTHSHVNLLQRYHAVPCFYDVEVEVPQAAVYWFQVLSASLLLEIGE
jgi:hypothetical protein